MAPFTMNASNIERFSALTTQIQKELFEVNKNLSERCFWALRRLEKKQDKRVLSARDGMLLVVQDAELWQQKPRFEPWVQPLLFIFICGPDFPKAKKFTQHSISWQIILFTSKSISLYTRNNNNNNPIRYQDNRRYCVHQ